MLVHAGCRILTYFPLEIWAQCPKTWGRSSCMLWRRGSSGVQAVTYPENLLTLTPRAEVGPGGLWVLCSREQSILFSARPSCSWPLSSSSPIASWLFAGQQKDHRDFLNGALVNSPRWGLGCLDLGLPGAAGSWQQSYGERFPQAPAQLCTSACL